jgi:hypothetical protein
LEGIPHAFIIESAPRAGASSLKFFLGSKANLTRPDRLIVGFNHPMRAIEYAHALSKRYATREIFGERVPFTFRVGNQVSSPVSFGKDINPEYEFKSWRSRVSYTIGQALSKGQNTYEKIRGYLIKNGINPDHWLPNGLVQIVYNKLRELDATE